MDDYAIKTNLGEYEDSYGSSYLKTSVPTHTEVMEKISSEIKINNLPQEIKVSLTEEEKKKIADDFMSSIVSDTELDIETANVLYENLGEFELEV